MESGLEKEHEKWKTDLALHKVDYSLLFFFCPVSTNRYRQE